MMLSTVNPTAGMIAVSHMIKNSDQSLRARAIMFSRWLVEKRDDIRIIKDKELICRTITDNRFGRNTQVWLKESLLTPSIAKGNVVLVHFFYELLDRIDACVQADMWAEGLQKLFDKSNFSENSQGSNYLEECGGDLKDLYGFLDSVQEVFICALENFIQQKPVANSCDNSYGPLLEHTKELPLGHYLKEIDKEFGGTAFKECDFEAGKLINDLWNSSLWNLPTSKDQGHALAMALLEIKSAVTPEEAHPTPETDVTAFAEQLKKHISETFGADHLLNVNNEKLEAILKENPAVAGAIHMARSAYLDIVEDNVNPVHVVANLMGAIPQVFSNVLKQFADTASKTIEQVQKTSGQLPQEWTHTLKQAADLYETSPKTVEYLLRANIAETIGNLNAVKANMVPPLSTLVATVAKGIVDSNVLVPPAKPPRKTATSKPAAKPPVK